MPFTPFEGRLAEYTENNITAAESGTLTISLPWIKEKKMDEDDNCHPVTGSSEHYALSDKFHEANSKDKRDTFHIGRVNTQAAEQLFAGMRKNNYFLNMMSPTTHVFLERNILHMKTKKKMDPCCQKYKRTLGIQK